MLVLQAGGPEAGEDVKVAGVLISSHRTVPDFIKPQKCSAGSDLKPHSCCLLSGSHDEAPPSLSGAPIRWAETQKQEVTESGEHPSADDVSLPHVCGV